MGNTLEKLIGALHPYEYHISGLSNGLRCVCRQCSSRVEYIGVAIEAGSRDEGDDRQGLAHFVEHTIFKGTRRRRAWHISNRMESVGGELNAYTSKETTVVYTVAPAGDPERAIELLGDLIANASFPAAELEKEKVVVVEEIKGALDNPGEAVYDEFETKMYAGSSLGHDILGSPESVRVLTGEDCRRFLDRFYTPGRMVVFAQGPAAPDRILTLAEKHFGALRFPDHPRRERRPAAAAGFSETRDRGGHQAHTLIGAPVFDRYDSRRYALFLYNSYLAGPSMNSLLNQQLRERRGLVYAVDSSVSLLSDTGMEYIYFGTDRAETEKCVKLIFREIDRLAERPLADSLFDRIRQQYCGQLLVNSDNRESTAMSMGKSVLFFNAVHDAAMTARKVMEVTPGELMEVARIVAEGKEHRLTLC